MKKNESRFTVAAIGTAVCVMGLVTVALCVVILDGSSDFSDRLTEVGDVIAGATLILTIVAAVVALLAYAAATGLPDLRIQVDFPFSELNKPSFSAIFQAGGTVEPHDFKQLSCTVRVRNDSKYSAKNPAIVVRLHDMAFLPGEEIRDWVIIGFVTTYGVTAAQWDGGTNYSIHGGSVRILPALWLHKLHTVPNPDPYIEVDILADGYNRRVKIPVEFKKGTSSSSFNKYADSTALWI